MNLEVATYRRMAADLRALEQQTRNAFLAALVALHREGVSGLEASRRLGVSQPHVARTLAALRLAGVAPAESPPAGPGRSEEAVPEVPSGPPENRNPRAASAR